MKCHFKFVNFICTNNHFFKNLHKSPRCQVDAVGRPLCLLCCPMFSRRERHAKTLEIAQEEVLTCLGICMYERLHRIYMRMREEECTCQVFAAVAVDTLSRSFEMAVERKQGISQLELLYAELAREEQQKQIRKEQKKIKRKRKKGKSGEHGDGKENCIDFDDEYDDKDDIMDKECTCVHDKSNEMSCFACEDLLAPLKNSVLMTCNSEDDGYVIFCFNNVFTSLKNAH